MRLTRGRLQRIYDALYRAHGPQRWWRARSHFEVMVGAVLVQNTNWLHAARPAVMALRRAKLLSPAKLAALPLFRLAILIRSSGTHGIKAKRLRTLSRWLLEQGGVSRLAKLDTPELRRSLLSVHGIGPETADCILVYVFGRPVFIADAYARRFLSRYGFDPVPDRYEPLRQLVESAFLADAPAYNEFHALIVRHSKELCRARPLCERCELQRDCAYGKETRTTGARHRQKL